MLLGIRSLIFADQVKVGCLASCMPLKLRRAQEALRNTQREWERDRMPGCTSPLFLLFVLIHLAAVDQFLSVAFPVRRQLCDHPANVSQ